MFCANCGTQVADTARFCQRCGHEIRAAGSSSVAVTGGDWRAIETEIRPMLAARQKIAAIKLVRERTGMGLKEAKEYVEQLVSNDPTLRHAAEDAAAGHFWTFILLAAAVAVGLYLWAT